MLPGGGCVLLGGGCAPGWGCVLPGGVGVCSQVGGVLPGGGVCSG